MSALFGATLALGIGLFVFATALPVGRLSLAERLRQFDVDVRVAERRRGPTPPVLRIASWEPLDALLRPLVEDLVRPLRGLLAATGLLRRDLETELLLLEGRADLGGFVAKQVLVASIVASWPALLSLVLRLPFGLLTVGVSLACAVGGFLLPYATLEQRWRARARRIEAELPQVINLLALALGLLGLEGAIQRVGQSCSGLLGAEFRRVHEEVSLDRGLKDALRAMAERNRVADLTALCNLLVSSLDQGLRLRESLATLATTIRERQANALLAEGGKGSLRMLFPMALVIMPVTLAVVIIPGLSALRGLGSP
jgi:tight adherence protein C